MFELLAKTKKVKYIALAMAGGMFVLLLIGGAVGCTCSSNSVEQSQPQISEAEKQEIQEWIEENDLNKYGDPKNTFYTGGTPLFNEGTGETIDLYEYILEKHPDRPWLK